MPKPYVTTVRGDIAPEELRPVLAHEHLYCDVSVHSGKADNVLQDVGLIARELAWFKQAGGRTVVEVTPVGIGRDAGKLREIATAADVHVVSGIAFYDQSTFPAW